MSNYQFTNGRAEYGKEILQTLSAKLSWSHFVKTKFEEYER